MKHTQGNWYVSWSDDFESGNIRSNHHADGKGALLLSSETMFNNDKDGNRYKPDPEETRANLQLASTAPELLKWLQSLMFRVRLADEVDGIVRLDDLFDDLGEIVITYSEYEKIKAVIDKATDLS